MADDGLEKLNTFFQDEAARREMTLHEFSIACGLNGNQLYTIRHGRRPGLKVCLDIARYTNTPITYILYLAGHITEKEAFDNSGLSPKTQRVAQTLEMMRDDPLYEPAARLMLQMLDLVLYKMDESP